MEKETLSSTKTYTIGLFGNPNCGKSTLFNLLTGLRQKVGNFPGVTVDKKVGQLALPAGDAVRLIDFPGTYSFYPNSQDERIAVQTLIDQGAKDYPDAILYVADVNHLEKHLLLFTQLYDLGLPTLLVLNMADQAEKQGLTVDVKKLQKSLNSPVFLLSARTGEGVEDLKAGINRLMQQAASGNKRFRQLSTAEGEISRTIQQEFSGIEDYSALLYAHHYSWLPFLSVEEKAKIEQIVQDHKFESIKLQVNETMERFNKFTPIAKAATLAKQEEQGSKSLWLDRILTHRVWGPIVFLVIMLLVFQAIFAWASYPMDLIDGLFGQLSEGVKQMLPAGWLTDLLTDGVLAGLGGVVIFVPQIAILFFLITILEEVGYMARAAFMFDRVMQVFGLNGRSMVALISSSACAIPAVMSTRNIANWKERLITIMVTPLISCSARIPVYTVLIGFVVPATTIWGIFNQQGLAFMGLYVLGILAALFSAWVFKKVLKTEESSYLMLELPSYRLPVMRNVWLNVWEKVKTFLLEAGKVIIVISMVLWVLATYGPKTAMDQAELTAVEQATEQNLPENEAADLLASKQLEASFAGHLGKFIEPAIAPLGFDWKMGIALITSFAAREVFVGTMATIYSIGSEEDESSVRDRMASERNPVTGDLVYTLPTSLSLLIFYVFAMMCMSTLAVVKRETKSWKWPIIQFVFMTAMAYLSSWVVYQSLA
ncbi:MAG: ferrous iron transport protein B [Saprospiraceae bacterium]|nr:ferrous iron transport protein B [Saprospiraceae bacterium]